MNRILLNILLAILWLVPSAIANETPLFHENGLNIQEMAGAQNFRYGLELYRRGELSQASKVFQHVLKLDCQNKMSQYYLKKIARKGPEFKDAVGFLNNLPCPLYNFDEEDFLPASVFYEKDYDLVLEQASLNNMRYRMTKETLIEKIKEYTERSASLEEKIQLLTSQLENAKQSNPAEIAALRKQLQDARDAADRVKAELTELQKILAEKQADEKKSNQSAFKCSGELPKEELPALSRKKPCLSDKDAVKTISGTAAKPENKSPRHKKALSVQSKTTASVTLTPLSPVDEESLTLQEKYTRLQERLRRIERAVAEKNKQLEDLKEELSDIQN